MARLFKCDKCGTIHPVTSKFYYLRAIECNIAATERGNMDVCEECYKEIFNIKEDK